jgi:hypothetical protein
MAHEGDNTTPKTKITASGKVRRVIQVPPDVATWLESMGGLSASVTFLVREKQRLEREHK